MNYLKTYENFSINEGLLPDFIKNIIKRIGNWSLVPKAIKAMREIPKDIDSAFDYLCQLFNVKPDKQGFLQFVKKEKTMILNESLKENLTWGLFIIGAFLVWAFSGTLLANLYEDDAIEFLSGEGYENIKIRNWSPIAEREEDITAIDFEAFDPSDSTQIEGVVIIGGSVLLDEVNYQVKIKKRRILNN